MSESNVIASPRNRGQARERSSTWETVRGQLRPATRVPHADRPVLAFGLGHLAARLNPDRPLDGAKAMFDAAWPGDDTKWKKRKRLLRLPGEAASDPADEGAYNGSGVDYVTLAEAAAGLLVRHDDAYVGERERETLLTSVVRGTTYLPALAPLPPGADATRDLVSAAVTAICEKIAATTDLTKLWEVLKVFPFTVDTGDLEFVDGEFVGIMPPPVDAIEEAADAAMAIVHPRWRPWVKLRFVPADRVQPWFGNSDRRLDWSYPLLRLGALARPETKRIFIVPEKLSEAFDWGDIAFEGHDPITGDAWEGEGPAPNQKPAWDWLLSIGAKASIDRGSCSWTLPETPYDPGLGYGWIERRFEEMLWLWLEIRPDEVGRPRAWLSVDPGSLESSWVPLWLSDGVDLAALNARRVDGSAGFYADPPSESFDGVWVVRWPKWIEHEVPTQQWRADTPIGLTDWDWNSDWLSRPFEGWLDELNNEELAQILFGEPDVRFVPALGEHPTQLVPHRATSLAAGLLRNLAGPDPAQRIDVILQEQAARIAKAGLTYHAAVVDNCRAVIERNRDDT